MACSTWHAFLKCNANQLNIDSPGSHWLETDHHHPGKQLALMLLLGALLQLLILVSRVVWGAPSPQKYFVLGSASPASPGFGMLL